MRDISNANKNLTLLIAYRDLSKRECQVLKLLSEGKQNALIAEELSISKKTVENHITNIGNELNIKGVGSLRKWLKDSKLS
ncbi:response regulator transcription factor [Fodinibius halophilus]|uniref:Response regulator transcription factor n=1 Tax=Fodinibius halophilus TaxID=1736908 RepID=A0A6M1T0I1_9BACT|nr:LuxR C-terminal-related transcriptional regulator [Fodinibius halophilus]NGP87487.1 response regulator transcription factor [Fodinibius halophilus]